MRLLTMKSWSPYVVGGIIGVLQFGAVMMDGYALGTSSTFVNIAGQFFSLFDGRIAEMPYFQKYMTQDKFVWQMGVVVGMMIGAFLSSSLSRSRKKREAFVWQTTVLTDTPPKHYVTAFLGGFIMLLGARIAGGCTSGHGISGMATLGLSSIITIISLFVGGILMAKLFEKRGG